MRGNLILLLLLIFKSVTYGRHNVTASQCDWPRVHAAVHDAGDNATTRSAAFLDACNVTKTGDWLEFMNLTWVAAADRTKCSMIERIGPTGEGGKYVCDLPTLLSSDNAIVGLSQLG